MFEEKELYSTKNGQVSVDFQGETVYSLNKKEYQKRFEGKNISNPIEVIKELSGYERNSKTLNTVFCASYSDSGVIAQKYFIEMDGGYPLPFIILRPQDDKKHSAVIYLSTQGKKIYEKNKAFVNELVKQGNVVLLPDLLGFGETGGGKFKGDSYGFKLGKANYNIWFYEIQTGRSLSAVHAADISTLIDFLENKKYVDHNNISTIAESELCPSLTYAAAFDTRIGKTALISPFVSYKSLLINRFYNPQLMRTAVGGMLQSYDIDDLYISMAPRKLLLLNMTDHLGNIMSLKGAEKEMVKVRKAYSGNDSANLIIRQTDNENTVDKILSEWIK